MDAPPVCIRALNLGKNYRSGGAEFSVFSNLNLDVYTGERLALVGESGAGKSTLLHLLGGLDRPTSGAVHFQDQNLALMDDAALADFRNRQVGFVWQIHYLLPEFTAWENVAMPLLIGGASREQAKAAARERLEEVGLASRAAHRAGELSGGEQQRVVLARALVARPKLLLADEPTGNLDPATGERIISLLASLHRAHGLTSVYVTHNLAFARRCDRVLALKDGVLAPAP